MSLVLSIASLTVSLVSCAGAAVFAVKARSMRIEAEQKASRAIRINREQRINEHLESSGGCAKLVSIGEQGCALALPPSKGSRPTHPDGTPYRYHEIVTEGWGHCDGCHQWGQWTIENPHECPRDVNVTVGPIEDSAEIGGQIGRSLRRARRNGL